MSELTQVTTFCGTPCCTIEEAMSVIRGLEDQVLYMEHFVKAAFIAHPNLDLDIENANAKPQPNDY